ncbi:MAG: tripartite-type tricarboxylate transporter receptor subunit TctC [Alphaproteobacteria bacterium]|jgi:tripartite-type tricarboxylate transporter receptor subunit TctC
MKMTAHLRFFVPALALAVATGFAGSRDAVADSVSDFYKGKTGSMVIGSSVGGGYNQYGRLIAKHIQRHVPGKPEFQPKNLPGASGRRALSYITTVAPADGLTIGIIGRNAHFDKLMHGKSRKSVSVDATKMVWLGSANSEVSLCVSWRASGIKDLKDASSKGMVIGSSGPNATDTLMARVLNQIAGTKIKVILGYPGSTEVHLAMERGEVTGRCGLGWASIVSRYYRWIENKKINLLVQLANKKHPDLPNVPFIMDFAKNEEERQVLRMFTIPNEMGRPFFMREGVPADRVKALQKAFTAALKDPKLLAEAKIMHLAISPLSGADAASLVKEVYATPPAALARVRAIINSKEKLQSRTVNWQIVSGTVSKVKKRGKFDFKVAGKKKKYSTRMKKGYTKVKINGKKAKSKAVKAGMSCKIWYEGHKSTAGRVECTK